MALHQVIQNLLLLGIRWEPPEPVRMAKPPKRLEPVITAIELEQRRFEQRAVRLGSRYRSGFWAIYLLSAIAVLCAVAQSALGLDRQGGIAEIVIVSTVGAIYWWIRHRDWHGEWLRARATAEMAAYLPLLTPLLDFSKPADEPNWYVRAFAPGQDRRARDDVAELCARVEPLAREQVANAWADTAFIASYVQWSLDILELQRRHHRDIAAREHALLTRVHAINASLFGLTLLAAILQLLIHALWLSLVMAFFPALGAALYGALAQLEAYRVATSSDALTKALEGAQRNIQSAAAERASSGGTTVAVKNAIESALALIVRCAPLGCR